MKEFFVSYNKADRQWAEWIAWMLEDAGFSTIVQAWDFLPGGNFVLDMQRATTSTRRTIAVLSPDYLSANFTQPEWAEAFGRDPSGSSHTLIPIRVKSCKPPGFLSTVTYVDLVGLDGPEAKDALLRITNERNKPLIAPDFPGASRRTTSNEESFVSVRPSIPFPGASSKSLEVWQEKLEFLLIQEAQANDSNQLFSIKKSIEETNKRIQEISGNF
jgi:hypothetical protein